MREPTIPKSGEEVKASTIADIIRYVKSIVPRGDGKTIKVKTSPGGSVISGYSENSASGAVKLVIGERLESSTQYYATYYQLDDVELEDGTDCVASLMESIADTIPVGTVTFGFDSNTTTVSEEKSYKVFYFDVAKWLE